MVLALAAVTAMHPTAHHHAPVYDALAPVLRRWTIVHVAQLLLLGPVALVVAWQLDRSTSPMARLARIALAAFALLYTAFDAVAGLGTGALVARGLALPAHAQDAPRLAVQAFFEHPLFGGDGGALGIAGAAAWLVGTLAAAVVLWREQGARLASTALAAAAVLFAISHVPPFGPAAMIAVATAVALRRATASPASA